MDSSGWVMDRMTAVLAGRYTIEAEIDQGGMATVYRALDLKHDRAVAIKVLRPDLAQAIGADRFLREIRTTANLSHPHILPLHDSGEVDGFLYYVMPFVKGESLRDRLEREGQLPVEDALQIAREVADALAYAHEEGVIHRDVKPANIMLERGHALLADFGIAQAKAGAEETQLTQGGMSLGTPSYMSPEQVSGHRELDGRADQYALGCVLYEMLAGHPPFTGTDIQAVMRQHLAMEAPSVTRARASVPKGVAKAVQRALAKGPADRFRSMGEVEMALAGATLPLLARIPMGKARAVFYATAAVAALAIAWVVGLGRPSEDSSGVVTEPAPGSDPNVVAVATFQTLGEEPDLASLVDRLARSIPDRLSQAEIGEVVAFDRVGPALQTAGADADPIDVLSGALGAGTVVTGTLSSFGDSLEIRVSCTNAGQGGVFFSLQPIRDSQGNIEEMVTTVADQVAGALAHFLDPFNPLLKSASPPRNPEAYDAYKRGMAFLAHPGRDNWQEASRSFLRAWELDSLYLDAGILAGLYFHQTEASDQADSLLARLSLFEDRMTRGQRFWYNEVRAYRGGEFERALDECRAASEFYPLEFAYDRGHLALYLNRPREAVESFRLLETGDGGFLERYIHHWPNYFNQYAEALHRLEAHDRELEIVQEGKRRYPEMNTVRTELMARIGLNQVSEGRAMIPEARRVGGAMGVETAIREMFAHDMDEMAVEVIQEELGRFEANPSYLPRPQLRAEYLLYSGRAEEAHALFEEMAAADSTNAWKWGWVGITAPLVGDTAQALEIEERFGEWSREGWTPQLCSLVRAQIRVTLGDPAGAVQYLEQAHYQEGRIFSIREHHMFILQQLQGYPPYDELMRPKG